MRALFLSLQKRTGKLPRQCQATIGREAEWKKHDFFYEPVLPLQSLTSAWSVAVGFLSCIDQQLIPPATTQSFFAS
jgi:hypothetical protein